MLYAKCLQLIETCTYVLNEQEIVSHNTTIEDYFLAVELNLWLDSIFFLFMKLFMPLF